MCIKTVRTAEFAKLLQAQHIFDLFQLTAIYYLLHFDSTLLSSLNLLRVWDNKKLKQTLS